MSETGFDLRRFPVHLGLGAKVTRLPEFDGTPAWYERYGRQTAADGLEGRLVTIHSFRAPWDTWEVHPKGEELVVCLAGRIALHQERDGAVQTVVLEEGHAVVNPPGVWHTADVEAEATALFITAGTGTELRPRQQGDQDSCLGRATPHDVPTSAGPPATLRIRGVSVA